MIGGHYWAGELCGAIRVASGDLEGAGLTGRAIAFGSGETTTPDTGEVIRADQHSLRRWTSSARQRFPMTAGVVRPTFQQSVVREVDPNALALMPDRPGHGGRVSAPFLACLAPLGLVVTMGMRWKLAVLLTGTTPDRFRNAS